MQDREEADVRPSVPRIACHGQEGVGDCLKQAGIEGTGVLQHQRAEGMREGEHHVEVLDRQQLGAPVLEPLRACQRLALWAMSVAAAVERDALVPANRRSRISRE